MHISVVVPFHNAEKYLEDCLRALLSQNYPRDCYEIIMIDNNSTDRSAEIVRRYPQVRLLFESKVGAYAARNRGVAESTGAIIAFTDSDCAPRTDWLRRIREAICRPGVCLVQGRQRFAFESLGLSILSDYEAAKAEYTFSAMRKDIYYGYANNMAVHRVVLDRIGPFLELRRGADVVLLHRVIEEYACDTIRYSPDMRVRNLEVTGVWRWFQKMHIYGRSFRIYGRLAQSRPLSGSERLQVLRATIRRDGYSVARSLLLILLLSVGLLYYELGRWGWVWRGMWSSRRRENEAAVTGNQVTRNEPQPTPKAFASRLAGRRTQTLKVES